MFKRIYMFIRNKIENVYINITAATRRKKLINTQFTIISNNCWAGHVYRYFGLKYLTPTIGLYFMADDYLKFIKNLEYYLKCDIKFIDYSKSKYKEEIYKRKQTNIPIGVLDDIEVVFLHYKTSEEAQLKWKKRANRVNFDNVIIKFSQQNLCTNEHIKAFDSLNLKKIVFVNKPNKEWNSAIYYPGYENELYVRDDITNFRKYLDITEFINSPESKYDLNNEINKFS